MALEMLVESGEPLWFPGVHGLHGLPVPAVTTVMPVQVSPKIPAIS